MADSPAPLRIAVLGSSNLGTLQQHWRKQFAELMPEQVCETFALAFGQLRPAMLDRASTLHAFAPVVRVFCDRAEDVLGDLDVDEASALQRVQEHVDAISAFHQGCGGWSIVHRFAVLSVAPDVVLQQRRSALVVKMNALLDDALGTLPQVVWVDLAAEAAEHEGPVRDARLWQIGRLPFADGFARRLARRWAALTLSITGGAARLVVVDLDNTLWGGVLGEDGASGVKLGGDYPGNAFRALQGALSALSQRGVALAICSKNDEDLALQAFAQLPAMILRPSDFAALRINWRPKWENVRDIAAELNLGLGSVLFIDDNPVEREAMRANLPEVKVLELPSEPALYAGALLASPYVASVVTTAEDLGRLEAFRSQQQRVKARNEAVSLDEYYASLGSVLSFTPLCTGNAARAVQLCQKTNQFNSTSRRYELSDLTRLREQGADIQVIGLEDRHSPAEDIGLLILRPGDDGWAAIDLYLLSCRVLGRGLEAIIPRWALGRAAQLGWRGLLGEIIETPRNTPVRGVFAEAGYVEQATGLWSAAAEPALAERTDWGVCQTRLRP